MSESGSIFGEKKKSPFTTGSGGGDEFAVDLNLTPLMDVMSNILFFLLAGFGALLISFLTATVPVQSEGESEPETPRLDRVVVNLQILPDSYKINCSNDKIPGDELAKLKQVIRKKEAGGYDNAALTAVLLDIKKKYPASDTIMMVPSETIVYEEIVAAMEASKEMKEDKQRLRLFPKAVIADLVKTELDSPPPVEAPK